jgi:hypothetical protein
MKVSLIKKLKLYFQYRKLLKEHKRNLLKTLGLKLDWLYRPYTVLPIQIPQEDIDTYGNPNLPSYINLKENYVKGYIKECDALFKTIGLSELVAIIKIEEYEENIVAIAFGFSLMDMAKFFNRIIYSSLFIIILSIISIFVL